MSGVEFDLDAFEDDLRGTLRASRAAFEGQYRAELNGLMGLSRQEIDEIIPGTADLKAYDALIAVVKNASANNLSQAKLLEHIEALGGIAKKIALKVPGLS